MCIPSETNLRRHVHLNSTSMAEIHFPLSVSSESYVLCRWCLTLVHPLCVCCNEALFEVHLQWLLHQWPQQATYQKQQNVRQNNSMVSANSNCNRCFGHIVHGCLRSCVYQFNWDAMEASWWNVLVGPGHNTSSTCNLNHPREKISSCCSPNIASSLLDCDFHFYLPVHCFWGYTFGLCGCGWNQRVHLQGRWHSLFHFSPSVTVSSFCCR